MGPWDQLRMHAAIGAGGLLVRVSMCLLHSFAQVFGEQVLVKSRVSRRERVKYRWIIDDHGKLIK